jgi:hypothetical protein
MSNVQNLAAIVLCSMGLTASWGIQQASAQTKTATQSIRPRSAEPWQTKIKQELPLLGHRNWILIVDSAYPLQTSPGVETIETGATLPEVTQEVLRNVDESIHVRPIVYMDAELPYLSEEDTPGVTPFRHEIHAVLGDLPVTQLPHEQIIGKVDEAGKVFHILILKTTQAIPYTSVFLQLDCKYLSADSEAKLRTAMKAGDK